MNSAAWNIQEVKPEGSLIDSNLCFNSRSLCGTLRSLCYTSVGWSDFAKKCYTFYVVPNCWRTPIQKFNVFTLSLSLVAGPQKIWTVTLKWAYKKYSFFQIFKVSPEKTCSLAGLNAKTVEIPLNKIWTIF